MSRGKAPTRGQPGGQTPRLCPLQSSMFTPDRQEHQEGVSFFHGINSASRPLQNQGEHNRRSRDQRARGEISPERVGGKAGEGEEERQDTQVNVH